MLKDMFLDPRVWVSNFSPQKGLVLASFFFCRNFRRRIQVFVKGKPTKTSVASRIAFAPCAWLLCLAPQPGWNSPLRMKELGVEDSSLRNVLSKLETWVVFFFCKNGWGKPFFFEWSNFLKKDMVLICWISLKVALFCFCCCLLWWLTETQGDVWWMMCSNEGPGRENPISLKLWWKETFMQSEHTVDGRNRVLPAIHDNPMRSEILGQSLLTCTWELHEKRECSPYRLVQGFFHQ